MLSEKILEGVKKADWKEQKAKATTTIRHCLADEVMYHMMDEESPTII